MLTLLKIKLFFDKKYKNRRNQSSIDTRYFLKELYEYAKNKKFYTDEGINGFNSDRFIYDSNTIKSEEVKKFFSSICPLDEDGDKFSALSIILGMVDFLYIDRGINFRFRINEDDSTYKLKFHSPGYVKYHNEFQICLNKNSTDGDEDCFKYHFFFYNLKKYHYNWSFHFTSPENDLYCEVMDKSKYKITKISINNIEYAITSDAYLDEYIDKVINERSYPHPMNFLRDFISEILASDFNQYVREYEKTKKKGC